MKIYIMLIMLLCLNAAADFKVDTNRFGVVQNILYTGYVMDAAHAKIIINKRIGKKTWVKYGNVYRCGDLFMQVGRGRIVVTVSHKMAMSHNQYATKLRTIRKTRTTTPLRKPVRRSRSA